jgi:SPP1 family predicted phage head-tail adaptor
MQIKRQGEKTLASEFKHRVWIQELSIADDGEGGFVETWTDKELVYASISPISAQQKMSLASIGIDATHIIKIRGNVDIETTG